MKKTRYAIIALAALAFSCTKSDIVDVPEAQKTPIAFDTYNGKMPLSKASEITKDNISSILVNGFKVAEGATAPTTYNERYMNATVSRTLDEKTNTWGPWGYNPVSYWPGTGTLEFVAYGIDTPVAAEGSGKLVPINGSFANFTYTVPTAVADQVDLIASNKSSYISTGGKVTFTMNHLLSRIGFTLKTLGTGSNVTISTIELHGNFINTGNVNLSKRITIVNDEGEDEVVSATPAIDTDNYTDKVTTCYSFFGTDEFFETTDSDNASEGIGIFSRYKSDGEGGKVTYQTDDSNRYMMIIPGTIDSALDADDIDNDSETSEVEPYIKVVYQLEGAASSQTAIIPFKNGEEFWTLVAGRAYEFVLTVSVDQIEFTGSVELWDETAADPGTPIY